MISHHPCVGLTMHRLKRNSRLLSLPVSNSRDRSPPSVSNPSPSRNPEPPQNGILGRLNEGDGRKRGEKTGSAERGRKDGGGQREGLFNKIRKEVKRDEGEVEEGGEGGGTVLYICSLNNPKLNSRPLYNRLFESPWERRRERVSV